MKDYFLPDFWKSKQYDATDFCNNQAFCHHQNHAIYRNRTAESNL
ncbi:hypothetical protein [Flavobacterium sp.]|nr:hypothetical protein [Flavobacterium sp.]